MALVDAWLSDRLNTAAGILVVTTTAKAFPIYAPQKENYPFITFRRSNTRRDYTMRKNDGKPFVTFDIYCWDDGYADVKTLADAVRIAIDGYTDSGESPPIDRAFVTDEEDVPEPPEFAGEQPVYGVHLVLEVCHTETVPTYT